ncbi:MAG: alpha-amylase family glycosyl hydrolase, partial [Trueperaceae bacterium]
PAPPRPWWHDAVVYQVYPRSFQDADGDGVGDLAGIVLRLDYLTWLGVDAIWLSPIYPSPLVDFGYDVSDYTAVDPVYGTLDDLGRLIAEAHARGLRLILDLVPSHTSDRHPWFQASRSSRDDPKRDWYLWRDPAPDGGPPNNWLSHFGGRAWTWDAATGQYYLHSFVPEQPDLNWRNPEVLDAMAGVMRFWLDRGIDGFRVDVIHNLLKDEAFRDDPPNPDFVPGPGANPYDALRHLHSSDQPDVHRLLRWFRRQIDAYPGRVLIGEVEYGSSVERLARFYGDGDELHLALNFSLMTLPWTSAAIADHLARYDAALPAGACPTFVVGNHDRARVATRIGPAQARVAAMLLLTARNTPFVYQGDELGMRNAELGPEHQRDPWGLRVPGHGRDPVRTPMRWDASGHAGFTTGEPWLPVGDDAGTENVARLREDERSILTLHRRLLALRRGDPVLTRGRQRVLPVAGDVVGYLREDGERRVWVALNLGSREVEVETPGAGGGTIALSTALDREGETVGRSLRLRGDEGCVVVLGRNSGRGTSTPRAGRAGPHDRGWP